MTNAIPARVRSRPAMWRIGLWGVIAGLLLLPAVAMRFAEEVNWTASDFVFAAVVLIGAGLVFELAAWRLKTPFHRVIAGAMILGVVLVVWVEGAVGIFH